jgi:4'-phosphopantetheinyl transferase
MASATLYLIDTNLIPDDQLTLLSDYLSPSESARYQHIARLARQRQFLVGRLLLRYAVTQQLCIPVTAMTLIEQERQAPLLRIDNPKQSLKPFYFSLAHTANWVACACSTSTQLGLDIERYDAKRNLAAIAEHTFHPNDVAWWNNQTDQVSAFYRLWSIKEARYKLTHSYAISSIEYCYEFMHPDMAMALMSATPLDVTPQYKMLSWSTLSVCLSTNLS